MLSRLSANVLHTPSGAGVEITVRPAGLIALIVVLYAAVLLLFQHEWWLGGGMYAEMATNYFPTAESGDWKLALFATDAGYTPLLQRLIALTAHMLHLHVDVIPRFYAVATLLLTPLIVGTFCLPQFRPLIACDATRLGVVVVALGVMDIELRGFINFTYTVTFLGAVCAALALHPRGGDAPKWAWVLPVLLLSKPYVLTLVPLFLLVVPFTRPGFRRVLIVSLVTLLTQAAIMVANAASDELTNLRGPPVTLLAKLEAFPLHMGASFGAYMLGPLLWDQVPSWLLTAIGLGGILGVLVVLARARHGATSLIVTGLAIYSGTVLINTFTLSSAWGLSLGELRHLWGFRHSYTCLLGWLLIVVALCQILADRMRANLQQYVRSPALLLFCTWLVLSGWITKTAAFSATPDFPLVSGAVWQHSAAAIEQRDQPVCVPIDPFPKMYGRSCRSLVEVPTPDAEIWLGERPDQVIDLIPPDAVRRSELRSIALMVRPLAPGQANYHLRGTVVTGSTRSEVLFQGNGIFRNGISVGLLTGTVPVHDVSSIRLTSDVPLVISSIHKDGTTTPVVLWMGQ